MATIGFYPRFQAFDSAGVPLNGGKLNTYEPNSVTRKACYSDRAATTAHDNPVVLNARGEEEIYFVGSYKLVLTDADDVEIWTQDPYEGVGYGGFSYSGDHDDNLSTAVTAIGATETTLYITAQMSVDGNVTIPNTLTLHFLHGGSVDQSTNVLILNGDVIAGDYQIFDGTGETRWKDGTTNVKSGWYSSLSAAITSIDDAKIALEINKAETVGSSLAFNANTNVMWNTENILTISDTFTLTFDSPNNIIAPDHLTLFTDNNTSHNGVRFNEGGHISVGWWGADDGTEITDHLDSVFTALDLMGDTVGSTVIIPPGDYTFGNYSGSGSRKINDLEGVVFSGYGAKITYLESAGSVFEVEGSDNLVFEGIYIDGVVATYGNSGTPIMQLNSTDNVVLKNCKFLNAAKEGLLISDEGSTLVPSKYITVQACDFSGAARNGIAITGGQYITIQDTKIHDVGQNNGTDPQYGIDLEPVASALKGITIQGCDIQNPTKACIGYINNTYDADSVTIIDTYMSQDVDDATSVTMAMGTEAKNIHFIGCEFLGRSGNLSGTVGFEKCHFLLDSTTTTAASQMLNFSNTSVDNHYIRDCYFEITSAIAGHKFLKTDARSGSAYNLVVDNCHFLITNASQSNQDIIDISATWATNDRHMWTNNYFEHTGSPATPCYANFPPAELCIKEGNLFTTDFRLRTATGLFGIVPIDQYDEALYHSATNNFGSIADGASDTTTTAFTGARMGDFVLVAAEITLAGLVAFAYVSAVDTITYGLSNTTGAPVDLANTTFRFQLLRGIIAD